MSDVSLNEKTGIFEISPTTDLERSTHSRGPILTFASTLAFSNFQDAKRVLGDTDLNGVDNGRQAQYLAGDGQRYLVNSPGTVFSQEERKLYQQESDTNCQIWRQQLGMRLSRTFIVSTIAKDPEMQDSDVIEGDTYMGAIAQLYGQGHPIQTPTINSEFLRALKIDINGNTPIAKIAEGHDILDTKDTAGKALKQTNIPIPTTYSI